MSHLRQPVPSEVVRFCATSMWLDYWRPCTVYFDAVYNRPPVDYFRAEAMYFLYPPLCKCSCGEMFPSAGAAKRHPSDAGHAITMYSAGEIGDRQQPVEVEAPSSFLYPAGFLCRFGGYSSCW